MDDKEKDSGIGIEIQGGHTKAEGDFVGGDKIIINPEPRSRNSESQAAKYALVGTAITAVLSLVGVFVAGYFGYLNNEATRKSPNLPALAAEAQKTISAGLAIPPQKSETSELQTTAVLQPTVAPAAPAPPLTLTIYLPSCECKPIYTGKESILIRLRWGAKTAELAERGAESVVYTLIVNGKEVPNLNQYRKPAQFVAAPEVEGDRSDTWWVYWDYPAGKAETLFVVGYTLVLANSVDNGWDIIPAGTRKSAENQFMNLEIVPIVPPPIV